ncbi:MAG TPA: 16S rRNA (cytidine(1402)-2'-O)-methyltransferase [Candidatus Eisenbacteria bacterium]|nr:16S rRNA (cytidine(1402)-2'-O)-methyltransferase [Candidatus Eisenbacteria bacterium]
MAGGVLYVVATPIGNLEDVTLRALRVLREVDVVAAEDTRRTRVLLQHHGIAKPLVAYHDAVERTRAPGLVERLRRGESVALVSDAGTPGIADPGYHLVRQALVAGVRVVPIPGPSAVAAITSVAGLPVDRFAFEGFLPNRSAARRRRLGELAREARALVFLEAPTRVVAMLDDALGALGDREAVVGRELTKLHEEILRGRLSDVRAALAGRAKVLGELVIVVTGAPDAAAGGTPLDLDAQIRRLRAEGLGVRDVAARLAAETGRPRRQIYQRALELQRGGAA